MQLIFLQSCWECRTQWSQRSRPVVLKWLRSVLPSLVCDHINEVSLYIPYFGMDRHGVPRTSNSNKIVQSTFVVTCFIYTVVYNYAYNFRIQNSSFCKVETK